MLKTRVIPVLLWTRHGLVKGRGFDHSRRVGSPLSVVRVFRARDVDELMLLDVDASMTGSGISSRELQSLSAECNFPLAVGGGLDSVAAVERVLRLGADKVVLNSATYSKPDLISELAREFGSQSIAVSIDYRVADGHARCFSHSGTVEQPFTLTEWCRRMESSGAGELVVCNCDRDGTMQGFDVKTLSALVEHVSVPVVAAGGAGQPDHFSEAIRSAGVAATAAGSVFLFTETTPTTVRNHLAESGIPVRGFFS